MLGLSKTCHSVPVSVRVSGTRTHPLFMYYIDQNEKRYIYLCYRLYFPSTGRAAASHTFVEYPHYPQQQTCSSSKWTSNSHVHNPLSIWRTRSTERGFSGSSGGLRTRMPTERTISLRLNSIQLMLPYNGRTILTLTYHSR